MSSFYINRTGNSGGPAIFGSRLKEYMLSAGYKWSPLLPRYNIIFSSGLRKPFSKNILRMNGIYVDARHGNTKGDALNKKLSSVYESTNYHVFQSLFSQKLYENFFGYVSSLKEVIHNGVPNDFSPAGPAKWYNYEKVLIASGRWVAHKRLKSIIDGFIYFKESSSIDAGLVILGDTTGEDIPGRNDICAVGRLSTGELPYYLRGGDAFISLSWLDNCPNSVIEAIACGLPVLTSHNGGTSELITESGHIIKVEPDYQFDYVDLYNPPLCDPAIVAEGIDVILRKRKSIINPYSMDSIGHKYTNFLHTCEVLNNEF